MIEYIFSYDSEETPECDETYSREMLCPECGHGKVYVRGQSEHEYLYECAKCEYQAKQPKGVSHRLRLWYSQRGDDDE